MSSWFKALLQKPRKGSKLMRQPVNDTSESKQVPSASQADASNSGSARWNKPYDVCICHNEGDLGFVEQLVSYLESQPERFRCFLQPRDALLGGAMVTELCDAVQNSHCWVLLITPNFLKDPWCRYQMHQALTESPMANGRTIPVLKDIDRRDYPRELRCIYYIRVTLWETTFKQIRETVMRCK
ncbi:hypothetical protein JRQ81_010847 [Phrynocephalus forsythii]|uniref:TIR domain-containing protein n=1 Tax=Phrynocephalus forsythii TaxID=171643 RepID=A0A9Q0X952_9SAUR|nr:hypothetical protein JRQ81_010847 [Phrynocephalus forsythii]